MRHRPVTVVLGILFAALCSALAPAAPITIASGEMQPYLGADLPQGGYAHELVARLMADIGHPTTTTYLPWERTRLLFKAGRFDATIISGLSTPPTPWVSDGFPGERLGFLKRKEMTFTLPSGFSLTDDDDRNTLIDRLSGLRVGLIRGVDRIDVIESSDRIRKQYIVDYPQGLTMLAGHRIDLLVIDKYTAADLITERLPHLIGKLAFVEPPLVTLDFHLALAPNLEQGEAILDAFNARLAEAREDGTLARILDRHGFYRRDTPDDEVHTLRIGTVDNQDMLIMRELSQAFEAGNPDIRLEWRVLDESILRQRLLSDLAISDGQYDVMSIGTLEAPLWAQRGWLEAIQPRDLPPDYALNDLIPTVRAGLSLDGQLYALPFYAESTMTYYRRDLFEQAGLRMPEHPRYQDILTFARTLNDPDQGVYGICLRGKAGWGENMALISTMVNTYGGQWFDLDWAPRLDSPAWFRALDTYRTLVQRYGPPNPTELGYSELIRLFAEGHCALWIDATVAAGALYDPAQSRVADAVGIAPAPVAVTPRGANWLWSWALAVPSSSSQREAALRFMAWATSRDYIQTVGQRKGWLSVPPGTRLSTYQNAHYQAAAPFSDFVLNAILSADIHHATLPASPYAGIQFVRIPEFPALGVNVGQSIARMIEGRSDLTETLQRAQSIATRIMRRAGYRTGQP